MSYKYHNNDPKKVNLETELIGEIIVYGLVQKIFLWTDLNIREENA